MQARACEICGKRAARYVCQECGREVCEACLEPQKWICLDCYGRIQQKAPVSLPAEPPFFQLFLLGFLLIFAGVIFMMITTFLSGVSGSFGATIIVGPIPIVFGAGPHYIWAVALAVALTILSVFLFILLRKQTR